MCLIFLEFCISPAFLHTGLYQDSNNRMNKGACVPLLIHTDKLKTKGKEKEERKSISDEKLQELPQDHDF